MAYRHLFEPIAVRGSGIQADEGGTAFGWLAIHKVVPLSSLSATRAGDRPRGLPPTPLQAGGVRGRDGSALRDQLERLNGRLVPELALLDRGDACGGFAVPA